MYGIPDLIITAVSRITNLHSIKGNENIVEKENKESIDFESWKAEYLAGDPVRKFF